MTTAVAGKMARGAAEAALPVVVASAPAAMESGEGARSAPPCCEDRRITRSKRALRDALIELMEERGFDGFTVNDLCVRADLNRGTFYNLSLIHIFSPSGVLVCHTRWATGGKDET